MTMKTGTIYTPPKAKYRLLWVERIFSQHRGKVKYIQLAMLGLFLLSLIGPLFAKIPQFHDTIFTSGILFSQFLFWGIWYSGCLFSVIFLGRFWCGVLCPLGALSEWCGKFGLKRALPKWMKWNGWLVIMFTIVTILGQTMDVRDDPAGMARLFLYIFALAIIIGFLYGQNKGRPWCRYFCPIGKILGIVSRLGMIDFRANKGVLVLPKSKALYVQGRLCPTDYNLPYKGSTNNCITCGACVHGKKQGGMGMYLRKPGEEVLDILNRIPNWSEVLFIILSPGLSAGGFLWLILHSYQQYRASVGGWLLNQNVLWVFNRAPAWIASQRWNQHYSWLDIGMITMYMLSYAVIFGGIFVVLTSLAALCLKTPTGTFKNSFLLLTYQYTPIAILSIVIGLSGKFFDVLHHDFGVSQHVGIIVKCSLLGLSMVWTLYLIVRVLQKYPEKKLPLKCLTLGIIFITIGVILSLWWPAISGYKYMSEVEQIRQHLIIPGN